MEKTWDFDDKFQVKCSDNSIYRVNPVYSFIEPGEVLAIDILRQNGGAKVDKMVFVAAKICFCFF